MTKTKEPSKHELPPSKLVKGLGSWLGNFQKVSSRHLHSKALYGGSDALY